LKHHVVPQVAIGDFDSVSAQELRLIKTYQGYQTVSCKKDKTDMELALS
jgi:thiamine pyrophosphokinase